MNAITDKADWDKKVFNESIVKNWKNEVRQQEIDMTENMLDWCIAELRFRAKVYQKYGAISVFSADVIKSDIAIPHSLKLELQHAVKSLEDVPEHVKDWHPGSDERVLDLVHPSLFPLIYGKTRILPNSLTNLDNFLEKCGEGITVPIPVIEHQRSSWPPVKDVENYNIEDWVHLYDPYSKKFQWLPCEVDISQREVKITSYINNLDPRKHKDLYSIIEQIITRSVPLWNMALTPQKSPEVTYTRLQYHNVRYDQDLEFPLEKQPQREEGESDDRYSERFKRWIEDWERLDRQIKATRKLIFPDVGPFMPPLIPGEDIPAQYAKDSSVFQRKVRSRMDYREILEMPISSFPGFAPLSENWNMDLREQYAHRGLQVIVKLANIHLTPEKPEYDGGSWHIEGQINEHICASAIYYYDNDNVTSSRLAFRQHSRGADASDGVFYERWEHDWLTDVFGLVQGGSFVQEIGSIETREDRMIVFPNILQHQVSPFKLQDPTKPGHRKILALFLVDPNIKVISTANVPCQRRDWWAETLFREPGEGLTKLPQELRDEVIKGVEDFPISLQEAEEFRRELMDERKVYAVKQHAEFEYDEFSLCEH
ncbi:hypothetical protein M422DRAFT_59118 [Sphaerobolus stellatus SS14]|nr:hypothetical protein M422DRAFT_59118 [Sphaerobolus stellatus SS14]